MEEEQKDEEKPRVNIIRLESIAVLSGWKWSQAKKDSEWMAAMNELLVQTFSAINKVHSRASSKEVWHALKRSQQRRAKQKEVIDKSLPEEIQQIKAEVLGNYNYT